MRGSAGTTNKWNGARKDWPLLARGSPEAMQCSSTCYLAMDLRCLGRRTKQLLRSGGSTRYCQARYPLGLNNLGSSGKPMYSHLQVEAEQLEERLSRP